MVAKRALGAVMFPFGLTLESALGLTCEAMGGKYPVVSSPPGLLNAPTSKELLDILLAPPFPFPFTPIVNPALGGFEARFFFFPPLLPPSMDTGVGSGTSGFGLGLGVLRSWAQLPMRARDFMARRAMEPFPFPFWEGGKSVAAPSESFLVRP